MIACVSKPDARPPKLIPAEDMMCCRGRRIRYGTIGIGTGSLDGPLEIPSMSPEFGCIGGAWAVHRLPQNQTQPTGRRPVLASAVLLGCDREAVVIEASTRALAAARILLKQPDSLMFGASRHGRQLCCECAQSLFECGYSGCMLRVSAQACDVCMVVRKFFARSPEC